MKKECEASHCTGHKERTALQRQGRFTCFPVKSSVFEPRVITRPHPGLRCAKKVAPRRTGSPPEEEIEEGIESIRYQVSGYSIRTGETI